MECQRRLCPIEGLNLLRSFGRGCMMPWITNYTLVLLIILRPKGSIKLWNTCWELVLCSMEGVEKRVCHMLSSPTTIAIRRVRRWRYLRCYMVVGVKIHCFGVRLHNRMFLDPMSCKKPRSKFVWWERTCELCNQGRRVIPIVRTKTLMACVKIGRTLSHKVNPDAFLFKAIKGS
jgi:hypothetical protein